MRGRGLEPCSYVILNSMSLSDENAPAEGPARAAPACPKCGRECRLSDVACARCGLLRSRWPTFRSQVAKHPVLDPLWKAAEGAWDEPARHEALHKIAATDWTVLSALSQRYSAILRQRPDDTVARRALDRLLEVAVGLPLPQTRRGTPGRGVEILKAALGLGLLVLAMLLTAAVLRR